MSNDTFTDPTDTMAKQVIAMKGGETTAEQAADMAASWGHAVVAVLDLHCDREVWDGKQMVPSGTCAACSEREDTYDDIPYPCATVRAIATALEAS
ncbi:hypothetical protein VA596_41540 [Amycolatopsis sp., V23-08]|uniref:Uncharacterized protein n=1 Tax=Amycolatopsis heterodermiae TaxID=3110235 RepID=A0ABU5RKL6_9PSEU|nr:hypothetical protein [Amycolatopsis sp., V23-08]MEA5366070.1 hypothetical protein [Amycolatopsis sp., V23-08]